MLEFYADIESEIYPQGSGHMPGYLANITGGMENMRQALEGIERHWPQMDNATLECIASDTLQIAAGWHALHAYIMARLNSRGQ